MCCCWVALLCHECRIPQWLHAACSQLAVSPAGVCCRYGKVQAVVHAPEVLGAASVIALLDKQAGGCDDGRWALVATAIAWAVLGATLHTGSRCLHVVCTVAAVHHPALN